MCLAIPGRVVELYEENGLRMGKVDFGGVAKSVCTEHVPDLKVGEYALVHVGFALARVDEAEAREVFEFLRRMNELEEISRSDADEVH